jgi:hypothetical protein
MVRGGGEDGDGHHVMNTPTGKCCHVTASLRDMDVSTSRPHWLDMRWGDGASLRTYYQKVLRHGQLRRGVHALSKRNYSMCMYSTYCTKRDAGPRALKPTVTSCCARQLVAGKVECTVSPPPHTPRGELNPQQNISRECQISSGTCATQHTQAVWASITGSNHAGLHFFFCIKLIQYP